MTKKKKIAIVISVGIVTCVMCFLILVGALNQLYRYKDNVFNPAEVTIGIQENDKLVENSSQNIEWNTSSDSNLTADKKIEIKNIDNTNENNADAWIRVCMIPRWKSGDNDVAIMNTDNLAQIVIKDNKYVLGDITFVLADNWNENWFYNDKDGYFYYKNIVPPDNVTTTLLKSVSIDKEKMSTTYNGLILQIDILADAIQADGNAVEKRWNNITVQENNATKTIIGKEGN